MDLKFGGTVRVKSGFYEGIKGIVTDYRRSFSSNGAYNYKFENKYYFEGEKLLFNSIVQEIKTWILEEELEKI